MKQVSKFVSILVFLSINAHGQTKKQAQYASIDFVQSMWNLSANTKGIIRGETWYKDFRNESGNAYIYMIHRNGGNRWYTEAKKKFPSFYANYLISNSRLKDKSTLKYYNKWAFFVDKKYLKPVLASSGERGETVTDYYPSYPHIVILYEQKAGSNLWVEIDRKTFQTEEEKSKSKWESDFINQKLEESNINGLGK